VIAVIHRLDSNMDGGDNALIVQRGNVIGIA
jgi:hypothetical protein